MSGAYPYHRWTLRVLSVFRCAVFLLLRCHQPLLVWVHRHMFAAAVWMRSVEPSTALVTRWV